MQNQLGMDQFPRDADEACDDWVPPPRPPSEPRPDAAAPEPADERTAQLQMARRTKNLILAELAAKKRTAAAATKTIVDDKDERLAFLEAPPAWVPSYIPPRFLVRDGVWPVVAVIARARENDAARSGLSKKLLIFGGGVAGFALLIIVFALVASAGLDVVALAGAFAALLLPPVAVLLQALHA